MTETEEKKPKKREPFARVDTTKVILDRTRRSEMIEYGPGGPRRRKIGGLDVESDTTAALKRSISQRRFVQPPRAADQPKRRGRPRKNQPEIPPHLETTTEKVKHEWDEKFGTDGQPVQVRNSLKVRLRRIDCEAYRSEADEFISAYEITDLGIRAQSYEMAVDGGNSGGSNMPIQKLEASRFLAETLSRIGRDAYDLCVCYLCLGLSATEIRRAGGHEERVILDRVRNAVLLMVGRVKHGELAEDKTMDAVRELLKRQGMGLG